MEEILIDDLRKFGMDVHVSNIGVHLTYDEINYYISNDGRIFEINRFGHTIYLTNRNSLEGGLLFFKDKTYTNIR